MFDGAQEHTYQLMKGHTLVRFEESGLWKAVLRIIHERESTSSIYLLHENVAMNMDSFMPSFYSL